MLRKYKRKGFYNRWEEDAIEKALQAVKSGTSVRKAADKFCVPKSSLYDRVSGKVISGSKIGRQPELHSAMERDIVKSAKTAATMGFGVSPQSLMVKTGKAIRQVGLKTRFTSGIPGYDWYLGVKQRHPDLALRRPEPLCTNRSRMLNKNVMEKYFHDLGDLLDQLGLAEAPDCIWNANETGFQMLQKPVRMVARKGEKFVPAWTSASRESVSVLVCGNAEGKAMSPMVIVKGKTWCSLLSL